MNSNHFLNPISRRRMLRQSGAGFGMLGLAALLNDTNQGSNALGAERSGILTQPHFAARAKRVIFLFMNGAPSHVDTFDPKPALKKHEGESPPGEVERKDKKGTLMASPFRFDKHGESGLEMSELFPNLARCADDMCVIRSMHTDQPNHEPGLLIMHSGNPQPIRPSMGSWASYGLGTENQNLPAYVCLCPGTPVVGPQLWSNAFLPAEHQGMSVDTSDTNVEKMISNLNHPRLDRDSVRQQLDLLQKLNRLHQQQRVDDTRLEGQIRAYELAFNMQREASEVFDISREPKYIHDMYGDSTFAKSCLLARRLAEAGVRYTQVYYVSKGSKQPWDTHTDNDGGHRRLCADSDRASAALITDFKKSRAT